MCERFSRCTDNLKNNLILAKDIFVKLIKPFYCRTCYREMELKDRRIERYGQDLRREENETSKLVAQNANLTTQVSGKQFSKRDNS